MPDPPNSSDAKLQGALDAARSLRTIRRFGCKVALLVLFAATYGREGHSFLQQLATLALISTVLGLAIGRWHGERVAAPYYTHFDEAAWLMLLAGLASHLAA